MSARYVAVLVSMTAALAAGCASTQRTARSDVANRLEHGVQATKSLQEARNSAETRKPNRAVNGVDTREITEAHAEQWPPNRRLTSAPPPSKLDNTRVSNYVFKPAVRYIAPLKPAPSGIHPSEVPTPEGSRPYVPEPARTTRSATRPLAATANQNEFPISTPSSAAGGSTAATARSRQPSALGSAPQAAVARLAPPALTTSFDSTNFDDNPTNNSGYYFIPPDPSAAAGQSDLVNVVNATIRIHQKNGTSLFNEGLASFFSSLSPLTFTFDPKVVYDFAANRFVIVDLEQTSTAAGDSSNTSRIFLAVSKSSDPTAGWWVTDINAVTTVNSKSCWGDYPGLAVDGQAIYVTTNLFAFSNGSYNGSRVWVIAKGLGSGGFYDGGTAAVSELNPYAGGGIATTTQPAQIFGTPPTGVGTFLVSYSGLNDGTDEYVQVVRLDDPLGSPSFSQQYVNIGAIDNVGAAMPTAPQTGSSNHINTNDRRALQALWRGGSVWMTTTLVPPSGSDSGEATAHWVELGTSNLASLSVTQQGNISGNDIASGTYTFFPSIAVDSSGNVVMGFAASGSSIHPGAYYTTRTSSDAAGTTSGSGTVHAGTDYYYRTFGGTNRWGDYTGTALDPANGCFWVYNEWAETRGSVIGAYPSEDGRWATTYGEVCFAAACPTDLNITNQTYTTTTVVSASNSITAGTNVTVDGTGNVTFIAGSLIALGNGFSVQSGGQFTAEISSSPCP